MMAAWNERWEVGGASVIANYSSHALLVKMKRTTLLVVKGRNEPVAALNSE